MRQFKRTLAGYLCAGCAVLAGSGASAAVISVNLTPGGDGKLLEASDVVGAVPAANWNNLVDAATDQPSLSNLIDNSGATTTVDLDGGGMSFGYSNNTSTTLAAPMDDDAIMMRTMLGESKNGNSRLLHFTQVPYAAYDVYVYFGGAGSDADTPYTMPVSYQIPDGSGSYSTVGNTLYILDSNKSWDGTYNQSTATTAGDAADGNEYVVFHNMTASEFRLYTGGVSRRAGFSGVQIVQVPEPACLALLAVGGMALLHRRRA